VKDIKTKVKILSQDINNILTLFLITDKVLDPS